MGTSQNHRIDIRFLHRCQIVINDFLRNMVLGKSLFHDRDKKRAWLTNYLHPWHHLLHYFRIHVASNGCLRSNHADLLISGDTHGCRRTWGNHAHHRNIRLLFDHIQRQRARRIAGNDNRFHLLCLEKPDDLPAVSDNIVF